MKQRHNSLHAAYDYENAIFEHLNYVLGVTSTTIYRTSNRDQVTLRRGRKSRSNSSTDVADTRAVV